MQGFPVRLSEGFHHNLDLHLFRPSSGKKQPEGQKPRAKFKRLRFLNEVGNVVVLLPDTTSLRRLKRAFRTRCLLSKTGGSHIRKHLKAVSVAECTEPRKTDTKSLHPIPHACFTRRT